MRVMRSIHTAHGGKLSLARVLRGAFSDGATPPRTYYPYGAARSARE